MKASLKKISDRLGFRVRRIPPSALEIQRRLFQGRKADTIFDVGASIGEVSREYRKIFPAAHLHAFEPNPQSFERLQQNLSSDAQSITNALALSDQKGSAAFQVNASAGTSSLLQKSAQSDQWVPSHLTEPVQTLNVATTTLDAYCTQSAIAHIDILKLDVQGATLPVLKGAEGLLREHRIDLVYCEVEFVPLYENQPLFWDVCQFLQSHHYVFHGLYSLNIKKPLHRLLWADAIFLSPKINWPVK